jgi:hypothetical protein
VRDPPSARPAHASDRLAAQKRLRDLKSRISAQSKKNFVLERDVRYLDIRIALLIRNRMDMDEVRPSDHVRVLAAHLTYAHSKTSSRST